MKLVRLLHVFAENIAAKIPVKIAPGGVDMIGSVLCIGVFQQEGGTLHAVVVRLERLGAARP